MSEIPEWAMRAAGDLTWHSAGCHGGEWDESVCQYRDRIGFLARDLARVLGPEMERLTRERDAAVYEAQGLRNAAFAVKEIARRALGEE